MLTRCPACETHFRVTTEQLKARSGRVRCGECQHVFNALDTLIEEPASVIAPPPATTPENAPLPHQPEPVADTVADEVEPALPPTPTPEAPAQPESDWPESPYADQAEATSPAAFEPDPPEAGLPAPDRIDADLIDPGMPEPELAGPDAADTAAEIPAPARTEDSATAGNGAEDWSTIFPEAPPPPRRWPWVVGSLLALAALGLQALLAFRVEVAVLWPEARPGLVALCEIAACEVGLPARVGLVGIEASDLHPDSARKGRLALTAALKNRAPFAQQFPHLELTLTDTADKAIARKVLAPADYLARGTIIDNGMSPNADVAVIIALDAGEMPASGYRLYLFYP